MAVKTDSVDNKKKVQSEKKKRPPCKPCKKGTPKRDSRGRCRCYEDEYETDHKSKRAKLDRASRNRARERVKEFYAKNGKRLSKNVDVDHKDGNPRNNSAGNLRTMSVKENRGRSNKTRSKIA